MRILTYTDLRKNFSAVMDQLCTDHTPTLVTRRGERPVVFMSLEDFQAAHALCTKTESSETREVITL